MLPFFMTSTSRSVWGILLAVTVATAQGPLGSGAPGERNRTVLVSAVPVFSPDSALTRVVVHYRISHAFFIFVRDLSVIDTRFRARGELVLELLRDADNVSAARDIRTFSLHRSTVPTGPDQEELESHVMFDVPAGVYRVAVFLKDQESGRSHTNRDLMVTLRQPAEVLEASPPVAVEGPPPDGSPRFRSLNRGAEVYFGSAGGYLLQVVRPPDDQVRVRWTMRHTGQDGRVRFSSAEGSDLVLIPGSLAVDTTEPGVTFVPAEAGQGWALAYVPFPFHRMEPGKYAVNLELFAGTASRSQSFTAQVVWPTIPFSLANPRLAVDALRHIATEEEMNDLTALSSSRSREAFRNFWLSKDPDTSTAYNQVMAEYYRRIDEGIRRFSSQNEPDGYKSDRGRIFALFGSPTSSERMFSPKNDPMEVWTYQNLKRRFVFTDPSRSGAYILTQSDQL